MSYAVSLNLIVFVLLKAGVIGNRDKFLTLQCEKINVLKATAHFSKIMSVLNAAHIPIFSRL